MVAHARAPCWLLHRSMEVYAWCWPTITYVQVSVASSETSELLELFGSGSHTQVVEWSSSQVEQVLGRIILDYPASVHHHHLVARHDGLFIRVGAAPEVESEGPTLSRCAMISTVDASNSSCTRRVTIRSVLLSMLAVASSRISSFLRWRRALARTTSCFSPADQLTHQPPSGDVLDLEDSYLSPALTIS